MIVWFLNKYGYELCSVSYNKENRIKKLHWRLVLVVVTMEHSRSSIMGEKCLLLVEVFSKNNKAEIHHAKKG